MNTAIRLAINKLNNILFEKMYSPVASTQQTNISSNIFNAKLDSSVSKHFFKSTQLKVVRSTNLPTSTKRVTHLHRTIM